MPVQLMPFGNAASYGASRRISQTQPSLYFQKFPQDTVSFDKSIPRAQGISPRFGNTPDIEINSAEDFYAALRGFHDPNESRTPVQMLEDEKRAEALIGFLEAEMEKRPEARSLRYEMEIIGQEVFLHFEEPGKSKKEQPVIALSSDTIDTLLSPIVFIDKDASHTSIYVTLQQFSDDLPIFKRRSLVTASRFLAFIQKLADEQKVELPHSVMACVPWSNHP